MKERNTPNTRVRLGIEEILPPGQELDVTAIKEALFERKGLIFGKDYSEGNLANALYVLSNTHILEKVKRGVYRKAGSKNESSATQAEKTIGDDIKNAAYGIKEIPKFFKEEKEKIREISNEICTVLKGVNLSDGATDKEFEALKTMIAFKDAIAQVLVEFE